MKKDIKRICIIGGSGTGKTTLANKMGKIYDLPIFHIDGINYFENWVERDQDERDKMIIEEADKDKWIMDGTYRKTLNYRLNRADMIIYLDYSTFTQVRGILHRFFSNPGKEKEEIKGCNERINSKFLWFVINWRRTRRGEIMNLLSHVDNSKVYIFKSRKQLDKWYNDLLTDI